MSRALVLRSTLLIILAGAFIAMVLRLNSSASLPSIFSALAPAFVQEPEAPTADDLAIIMLRLNLSPEHLAAAGLTPQETSAFIANIAESLIAAAPALAQVDQSVAVARAEVEDLRRIVRSGQASSDQKSALATALDQLAAAQADRDSILNNLHALTHQYLNPEQAQKLTVIRGNTPWTVPTEYIVVERSQAEWVALREALADERISAMLGEEPDENAQALLTQANSDQAVTLAKASLETNLAQVEAAWDEALDSAAGQE